VEALLAKSGAGWPVVQTLLDQGHIVQTEYQGETFYLRRFQGVDAAPPPARIAAQP
jgi:hypothetical protein